MTLEPGSTWSVTKACSEAADASASGAIRQRPIPFGSCTSTAMPVRTFLPLARPPRSPGSSPPMKVSSTSTVPASRSRPGRTSTDRSRCSIAHTVWYEPISSVRCRLSAEMPSLPLTEWVTACWLFASGKAGISALSLQRTLEIGSYQTVWAMLHRLRSVLVRPGRDRLAGTVEVDETFIGGEEPGLRGGRARGKKVLTGIAVEVHEPKGIGRCRMAPLADASAASLHAFVTDHVEPGSRVITDAWQGQASVMTLEPGST